MNELKPCPFCGGAPDVNALGDIYCNNEGCSVMADAFDYGGEIPTSAQWNTRPIEDALRAELANLRARVAELQAENEGLTVERDYYRALATQRNG